MGRRAYTEKEFFWDRVTKTKSCWLWGGHTVKGGYGQLSEKGKTKYAHVWIYEKLNGKITDELTIDHKCNNPSCVNPSHLQAITQLENNLRSEKFGANKTHCPKGHKYTESNTYERPNKKGLRQWRECKICINDRSRKYIAKLRQENPEKYKRIYYRK